MAPHFEHKLFLTATPHNGYQESFSALLELLDDQRFARGTMPDRKQLGAVMVRRLKSELPKKYDGSDRFPKRKIEPLEVPYTAEEKAVHAALKKYTKLRHENVADNTEKMATEGKKRLHRITTRLVPDTVLRDPAMIAHARLVVIGGDSHRLHEEIITAGGSLREGRFARMNVGQVQDALAAMKADEPSTAMKESLLGLYPKHADALRAALEARMNDRTSGLQKALGERLEKEVGDIQAILTELKRTIEDKLDDPELKQMTFEGWADEEQQQLECNMTALRARVLEIPGEIERETEAIKRRFANPQPRIFPVSVTFLVPERLVRG
jgi:hypothetical protein